MLTRRCSGRKDAYDKALKDVDILVMPTVGQPPRHLGEESVQESPLEGNKYLPGVIYNTCPFDCTSWLLGTCSSLSRVWYEY